MTQQTPTSTEVTFWSRVSSFPVVQDGLNKVHHYANQTSLSRYALQQAETTISKANEFATPYTERYIKKADALGCRSLDILEQHFPAVTQPTDELVQAVRHSPQQLVSSVSIPVNKHMLTAAGNIENLVDKWLPPTTADGERQDQQQTNGKAGSQQRDIKKEDDQVAIARFYHLANSIKDRLHQRIEHIPRSKADITRLAETNQLLQDTMVNVQTINTQLQGWVTHSRNLAGSRVDGLRDNIKGSYEATQSATQQRIHDLTVELFHRLDVASDFLKQRSNHLPDFVQVHLEPLTEFAGHEYNIIRTELLKEDVALLQKATNILQLSHDYIVPLLQTSVDGIQEQIHSYSAYAQSSLKGFTKSNGATASPTATPVNA